MARVCGLPQGLEKVTGRRAPLKSGNSVTTRRRDGMNATVAQYVRSEGQRLEDRRDHGQNDDAQHETLFVPGEDPAEQPDHLHGSILPSGWNAGSVAIRFARLGPGSSGRIVAAPVSGGAIVPRIGLEGTSGGRNGNVHPSCPRRFSA